MTWSVLQRTAPVSEHQLNILRALRTTEGYNMGNNYRPVTPLNGRRITVSSGAQEAQEAQEAQVRGQERGLQEGGRDSVVVWQAGLVPGWAVLLISLAVALNVGLVVWLVMRRSRGTHSKLPTEEH